LTSYCTQLDLYKYWASQKCQVGNSKLLEDFDSKPWLGTCVTKKNV